jgi:hypothetical protein
LFLACPLGASIQLLRTVSEKPLTILDLEKETLYHLIWMRFFGVCAWFAPRMLRARSPFPNGLPHSPLRSQISAPDNRQSPKWPSNVVKGFGHDPETEGPIVRFRFVHTFDFLCNRRSVPSATHE